MSLVAEGKSISRIEVGPIRRRIRPRDPEIIPEGKTGKFCSWCCGLAHRRPLTGCPGCGEEFGREPIGVATGLASAHHLFDDKEDLIWER